MSGFDLKSIYGYAHGLCRGVLPSWPEGTSDQACELRDEIVRALKQKGWSFDRSEQEWNRLPAQSTDAGKATGTSPKTTMKSVRRLSFEVYPDGSGSNSIAQRRLDMVFWIDGKYVDAALDEVKRELGPKLLGSDHGTLIDIANALASISSLAKDPKPLGILEVDNLNNLHGFYLKLLKPTGFTKQHALQISKSSENTQIGMDQEHLFLRVRGYFAKPKINSRANNSAMLIDTNDLVLWIDLMMASPHCSIRSLGPMFSDFGGSRPASKLSKLLIDQGNTEALAFGLVGNIHSDAAKKIVDIQRTGLLPAWCSQIRTSALQLTSAEIELLSDR